MKKTIRMLALVLAIAACVGLLSACGGSRDDAAETTPSDMTGADNNNTGSTGDNNTGNNANGDANGNGNGGTNGNDNGNNSNVTENGNDTGATTDERYVAKVTSINDDGTITLTLCSTTEDMESVLSDYANVDMEKFTPTSAVVNYTVPDEAMVYQAADGKLEEGDAETIAAGDMLVIYSESGKTNIVIYPTK